MSENRDGVSRHWLYVPSLYFAEGLPYVLVNTVSVILYKRMGVDNARMAFWTSWLYLPWVLKMFWGPLVDLHSTKRAWAVRTQLAMAACLGCAALPLGGPAFFALSLAAFLAAAFVSATHDIAVDGFYMLALDAKDQAWFVGIRAAFYRLAMIAGSGLLVFMAGRWEPVLGVTSAWALALSLPALLMLGLAAFHGAVLPRPPCDRPSSSGGGIGTGFAGVVRAYFAQPGIGAVVAFILLYRFAEAMMLKLAPPFLLDPASAGGMGLSTSQVGLAYGTIGIGCLVLGGVTGGSLIARYGFRRCLWPMVISMHLPDLFYVWMAFMHPDWRTVYALVALEQFGYGLGFTAFMVYLMYTAREPYKTSHYAISTGIMALGMMLPGFVSGWLQQMVGYKAFFVIVCIATIPGMLVIPFIPRPPGEEK
jgi:PAT family beta-lactamase induction signal transducer AmpG